MYDSFQTLWTLAHQTPLSIGFWSGLPFLSPGDLLDPGIEPASLALAGGFFTTEPPGNLHQVSYKNIKAGKTQSNIVVKVFIVKNTF